MIKRILLFALLIFSVFLVALFLFFGSDLNVFDSWIENAEYSFEIIDFDIPERMVVGELYVGSITVKNTGKNVWTRSDGYRLGVKRYSSGDSIPVRLDFFGEVEKGEVVEFRFLLTAPSTEGSHTEWFRMLQENGMWFGNKWFGDKLSVNFEVEERASEYDMKKFDLILSDDDIEYFQDFTEASLSAGNKRGDLNDWRKAQLVYDGEEYEIKVKIHGGQPLHYSEEIKSYRIKLLEGKYIDGYNEFSFVVFNKAGYKTVVTRYYIDLLNLFGLSHDVVLVSLNGGEYNQYGFRENKSTVFFEKNGLRESAFVYKSTVFDYWYNEFITAREGGGHQNILSFEFSFNEIGGNTGSEEKINYLLYLLNNSLESPDDRVLKFFDYDYLVNFEVLRTILLTGHDVAGDNLKMIYSEINGKFYPMVASEVVHIYSSGLLENEVNRQTCIDFDSGAVMYSDLIEVFSAINMIDSFRQDKYKKVFELISDDEHLDNLLKILGHYPLYVEGVNYYVGVGAIDLVLQNIRYLKNELSYSKLLILVDDDQDDLIFTINPMSISELVVDNFELIFANDFNVGDVVRVRVKNQDREKVEEIYITELTNRLDLSEYLFDNSLFLGLNDDLSLAFNETEIVVGNLDNAFEAIEISVDNIVVGKKLVGEKDVFAFSNILDYNNAVDKYFNYRDVDTEFCNNGFYTDLSDFDWTLVRNENLLQSRYLDLWQYVTNEDFYDEEELKDLFGDILLTLQNYRRTMGNVSFFDVVSYDLSLSKIYVNIIRKSHIVDFELLPISLANLELDKVVLDIRNDLPEGQKIKFEIEDADGNVLSSREFVIQDEGGVIDISELFSGFQFNSDLDEDLKVKKTKFFVKIEFVGLDESVLVESVDFEGINTVTGVKISDEDIVYAIADGNYPVL